MPTESTDMGVPSAVKLKEQNGAYDKTVDQILGHVILHPVHTTIEEHCQDIRGYKFFNAFMCVCWI